MKSYDVAIVGSGLAGLTVALNLADYRKVGIITKREFLDGASNWAQGGIAAVLAKDDSPADHIRDTEIAGAGLCNAEVTRYVVERGRQAIEWLIGQGVPFTRDETSDMGYHLTREGGHSHRRVIHAADATGHAVQTTLEAKVKAHPNITVLEHHMAVDLITGPKLGQPERSLPRALRARRNRRTGSHDRRRTSCAGHRRRRQGLPVHHQSGHRDRRRHRHGLARRLHGGEHGVHPVPPDLPVSPARQVVSDLGSGAR